MIGRFGLLIAAAFLATSGGATAQSLIPTFKDVPYGTHPLEKLDVYLAAVGPHAAPTPVCIEIHAGGWAGGEKSFFDVYGDLVERIYSHGIAIVSIDYPIAPQDLFPAANLSCQKAVQYVRANAAQWNLDPNNISVLGCSSGAHLAMWVAAAADAKIPGSTDPVLQQSSRVKACIAYAGPSALTDQYYSYDPSIGHGTSPVWAFLGVTTQAEWDALPDATKNYLSPRWHVTSGASPDNANLRFLGIFKGDPKITSETQLPTPNGDIHDLVQGLAFQDALRAAGATEAIVWQGSTDYSTVGGLYGAPFGADWLAIQLSGAKMQTILGGTPGCLSQEYLSANSPAKIANTNFQIRCYNALPSVIALLLVTNQVLPAPSDLLNFGFDFIIDPYSPLLLGFDMAVDSTGLGMVKLPIPNDPWLVGHTYYAQAVTAWYDPATGNVPFCSPSKYNLASSEGLAITIQ
jgi:acetyl esterase/lipase